MIEVIVNALLIWCFIGSIFWIVLERMGRIQQAVENSRARGYPLKLPRLIAGTIGCIVAWPWTAYGIWRHPKRTVKHLAKMLWGRM